MLVPPSTVDRPAGDAMGERRGEVGAGIAHIHDVHQLAERRLARRLVQQQLEVLEAGRSARLERAGRDGVDADATRTELVGEIPARRFERGLDRPHDVVVRHHAVGAQVAHGEHRAAVGHQRCGKPGHADEGMAGDIHCLGEALGRAIEQGRRAGPPAVRRRSNAPGCRACPSGCADLVEHGLELPRDGDVERAGDRGLKSARQWLDMGASLFVQPGHGELGAGVAERPGAAVRRSTGRWRCRRQAPCARSGPVG